MFAALCTPFPLCVACVHFFVHGIVSMGKEKEKRRGEREDEDIGQSIGQEQSSVSIEAHLEEESEEEKRGRKDIHLCDTIAQCCKKGKKKNGFLVRTQVGCG